MSSNPPLHASIFHGQKSISIANGHFQQNVYYSAKHGLPIGLSTLLHAASLSAAHDAADRDPPPRCAQGTREKIIKDTMTWITDFSPPKSVMWLNGPFGNGKSAFMQTIADRLCADSSSKHLLAASFFFGRGKPGRDKAKYLIPTIAYQISVSIPSTREVINDVLIQDPTILSKSIDAQLRYLITNPLRLVVSSLWHTPTVLIDGLDECEGHEFQRLILKAIFAAVLKEHIPLRFLIASRPESQISETYHTKTLNEHHYSVRLVHDNQTCEELRQFLQSSFDEMYQRRFDLGSTVKRPWPSKEDLSTLVDRASGQFLYASTVLRFVDSDMAHPTRQLALILARQTGNAFSNMDELYSQILESCPCQEVLPSFFHSLLTKQAIKSKHNSAWFFEPTLANYSAILAGLQPDDFSVILRCLPAIIEVEQFPNPADDLPHDWPRQEILQLYSPKISIHHQSFIEFITDHRRSGKFHVNLDTAYEEMKARLDVLVVKSLSEGENSPRIHRSIWLVIEHLLHEDLLAHGLGPSFCWPQLKKTVNDFKDGRIPPLSKPCPEFLDALRHVLGAMQVPLDCTPDSEGHIIQEITSTLTDIYDRSFLLTISPDSEVWKIAGVLALVAPLYDSDRTEWTGQFCKPGWCYHYHQIYELPQLTGLPLATIFRILEENWNFFDVDMSRFPLPQSCGFNIHMRHHEAFLENEIRSRDLYITYRSSAVRALKFAIMESNVVFSTFVIFISFCAHGWDIRINEDLRKGSAMSEVIDLVWHDKIPIVLQSPMLGGYLNGDPELVSSMSISYVLLQWLIKQLQILNVIQNQNHAATTMIQHLRDIMDRSKEDAIIVSFECGRQRFWGASELRPYGGVVFGVDVEGCGRWDEFSTSIRKFYSDISFFWRGMSAECHASILGYHLHVLISWIYFLVGGWPLVDDDVDNHGYGGHGKLGAQFGSILHGVQWEYHLLRADAGETIHDQLLTIHYIFAIKQYDDSGVKTRALERLPTPVVRGGPVWFRKHYPDGPNEAFDMWCEEVIAMRGLSLPKF